MKLNKKQKRTATIASMAALLAVVLGMGGQTFAKYITTNTTEAGSAVVAQWGVVIRNSIEDTIDGAASAPVFTKEQKAGDKAIVKALGDYNVVAPGSSGSLTIEVTGVPEVASSVSFTLSNFNDISLSATGKETYYPITWYWNDVKIERTDDMETLISNKLTAASAEFEAGVSIETQFKLSWAWVWSDDDDISAKDTLCGNAAKTGSYTDENGTAWSLQKTISFDVATEVAQIKEFTPAP